MTDSTAPRRFAIDLTVRGVSHTGVVHLARRVRHDDRSVTNLMLEQRCGMSRRQRSYLGAVEPTTPITCKKCLAAFEAETIASAAEAATAIEDAARAMAAERTARREASDRARRDAQREVKDTAASLAADDTMTPAEYGAYAEAEAEAREVESWDAELPEPEGCTCAPAAGPHYGCGEFADDRDEPCPACLAAEREADPDNFPLAVVGPDEALTIKGRLTLTDDGGTTWVTEEVAVRPADSEPVEVEADTIKDAMRRAARVLNAEAAEASRRGLSKAGRLATAASDLHDAIERLG